MRCIFPKDWFPTFLAEGLGVALGQNPVSYALDVLGVCGKCNKPRKMCNA